MTPFWAAAEATAFTWAVGWEWWPALLPAAVFLAVMFLAWTQPYRLLRAFLWLLTHSFYRLRVEGRNNVPAAGAALLICNRVSYLDWLLLLPALRRRLRPVLFTGASQPWLARCLVRWSGAIPMDGSAGQPGVERALKLAGEALERGEAVVLFVDNHATPAGLSVWFHDVYRRLIGRAPVVPVSLDQAWGSLFHPYRGQMIWKRPPNIPYRVWVSFGPPLPSATPAAEVCQAVQKLSADGAIARARKRRPCHRQFIYVAARHPFRPCLIDSSRKGQDLTYAKALAGSAILARALRPLLGETAMVGVWLPPSTGAALANVALAFLDKTSVNLNYSTSAEVVRSSLRQCGIRHVLTSRRFTQRLPLDPGPDVELIYLEDFAAKVSKWQRLRTFLAIVLLPGFVMERWVLRLGGHKQDDLATVIFSSGSTGDPKGVMLTHGNVAANVESIVQGTGLTAQDRILGVLPFFHSFGYTVTLWAPLQLGMSVVYHADPRAAREIGELCREHRCTVYVTTPTFLRFCLRKCDPNDFASLHFLICGAEKLPASLAQDFHKKFGVMPLEGYGCTELAPVASANLPDEPIDGYLEVHNKPGSIGLPLPGIATRIHHPETLALQPPGEEGLLFVLGANVMKGYLNRPELTAAAIHDGWYNTGDVGWLDDDGFVTLTGRLSRFAKSGGEMVPLQRIEEELHDVLGTSELVCGVTCVPDEARGERLAVLYVPQQLEALGRDVRGWLQGLAGRGLPSIWLPVERDFFPVEAIPVLGSGKLDLRRLKELALTMAKR